MIKRTLHVVLIILPSGTIRNLYKIKNIEVLRDDLSFAYSLSPENINQLITSGEYLAEDKSMFMYHKFEW